jgi:hypothetical protein
MKPSIFYCAAFLIVLTSCKSRKADKEVIAALRNNMETVTRLLHLETEIKLNEMRDRLNSPYTGIKASAWFPKASGIDSITRAFIKSIEQNGQTAISNRELESLINQYRKNLFGIDQAIQIEFQEAIKAFPASRTDSGQSLKYINTSALSGNWKEMYFSNIIQQALVLENKLIMFCMANCPDYRDYYSSFSAIVGQNSSVVAPSEQLSIMAGIGSFSRLAQAIVTINGQRVNMEADAVAYYNQKAPSKPGKYKVPVEIDFTDQDGKKQKITKIVEYAVRN